MQREQDSRAPLNFKQEALSTTVIYGSNTYYKTTLASVQPKQAQPLHTKWNPTWVRCLVANAASHAIVYAQKLHAPQQHLFQNLLVTVPRQCIVAL